MTKIFKRLTLATVFCLIQVFSVSIVFAFNIYYSETSSEYITKGVVFESSRKITDMGLLDVFTIRIPVGDPAIKLAAAASSQAVGLKETTSKLLGDSGAIAGINGDFFGVAGNYSMPLGLQVDVNGVVSVSSDSNTGKDKYSSFMLSSAGEYFMGYVNVTITFLNNGEKNIDIGSINKAADLAGTACITRDLLDSTAELDERIDGLVKIVVENDFITYISQKGETVDVPQNGYVIIMNSDTADSHIERFWAGQQAELIISPDIDIFSLQSAISGGGKILSNGYYVEEGSFYISGVHPRTAIGLNEDCSEIILMAVDGRSHSVGVSHAELAELMLQAGAFNAMHLDGGGSSEMVVQFPGYDTLRVVNYPSGGFERKVINALGLYVTAPVGEIKSIVIEPAADTFIKSIPLKVKVYGLDEYMRKIELPEDNIYLSCEGEGSFFDGFFNAFETGTYTIKAYYNGFSASHTVYATEIYELIPDVTKIKTGIGGKVQLNYYGIGQNGNTFTVDSMSVGVEVVPPGLGRVENGTFTALSLGVGYLRCFIGNTVAYIPIESTIVAIMIDELSGKHPVSFSSYPENVAGGASYSQIPNYYLPVTRLNYRFDVADFTQAAYADFEGIEITAKGLRLSVYGDLSGFWLRGRVIDANGEQYLIDFARVIDWDGWAETEVWFPDSMAYPIILDRIYVASTSNESEVMSQIYFCNLRGIYDWAEQYPKITMPESSVFSDELMTDLYYGGNEYSYDITIMADISYPEGGDEYRQATIDAFMYNSITGIYIGNTDKFLTDQFYDEYGNFKNTSLLEYKTEISTSAAGNLYVLQMTAKGGGFMFADKQQWASIERLLNQSYTPNILIITDVNPRNFTNKKEFELFHNLLKQYVKNGDRLFVVSPGSHNDVFVADGVRYITLAELYSKGGLNDEFSVLRFRLSGDAIRYSLERVFPEPEDNPLLY